MIAARLAGYRELGLGALVAKPAASRSQRPRRKRIGRCVRCRSNDRLCHQRYQIPSSSRRHSRRGAGALESLGMVLGVVRTHARFGARAARAGRKQGLANSPAAPPSSSRPIGSASPLVLARRGGSRMGPAPLSCHEQSDVIRIAERAVSGEAFSTPRMSNRRRKSFQMHSRAGTAYPRER